MRWFVCAISRHALFFLLWTLLSICLFLWTLRGGGAAICLFLWTSSMDVTVYLLVPRKPKGDPQTA